MIEDLNERVPKSSRCSTAIPGSVYAGNDADRKGLHQGFRRDKDERKNVFADADCGRDVKVEYGFTPRSAIACKHNGASHEFQEQIPQTGGLPKQCEKGVVHQLSDGNYFTQSEHHRVNHHERIPRRTREDAPKLSGFLQNEHPVDRNSRANIPRCSNQKTAEEVRIDRDEELLNIKHRNNRADGPIHTSEISPFMEFPPWPRVYDEDSETPARIQARHVEWQYRLDRNIEPLRKENPEVILDVYLLARDYQDMDEHDRPQYGLLAKAALGFLRRGSKPVDLEKIVSALRRYCAEEEQRTDTHLRACMAQILCNKGVLKKLWYRDDYIELMTGPDSASSMAALLQVALLDSL
ncbi:hypothetical protein MMC22_002436 [Lobaria immixta]|nr:hypothetical protein [Lobaria immixta]